MRLRRWKQIYGRLLHGMIGEEEMTLIEDNDAMLGQPHSLIIATEYCMVLVKSLQAM